MEKEERRREWNGVEEIVKEKEERRAEVGWIVEVKRRLRIG